MESAFTCEPAQPIPAQTQVVQQGPIRLPQCAEQDAGHPPNHFLLPIVSIRNKMSWNLYSTKLMLYVESQSL